MQHKVLNQSLIKGEIIKMNNEFVKNIKKAYITPFGIFINALTLLFCSILFFYNDLSNKLPQYIYIFFIFWVAINIIYYIQDKRESFKTNKLVVIRYIVVNVLCGYSIPMAFASVYVFGATSYGFQVFDYWLMIMGSMLLSWLGLHIFVISEFDISSKFSGTIFNLLGILLKLISFASLIYLSLKVPAIQDENNFIWGSMIIIICSDLLIGRSYFNYAFYITAKEEKKGES